MSEPFVDAHEPLLAFPTVIREFQLNGYDRMLDELIYKIKTREEKSRPTYDTESRNWQTDDFLHKHDDFKDVVNLAYKCGKEYVNFMQYEHDDIVIHEMWANVYRREEDLHMHNHPNAFISGVLYLTDGSEIEFYDPKTDLRSVIMPAQFNNFYNAFNLKIKPTKGKLILFPSWLKHSVSPQPAGWRASIAFNIMLEGKIGSRIDKTASYIGHNENGVKGEIDFNDDLL
jgi:uncharacterized protein (TIGR02466 family)